MNSQPTIQADERTLAIAHAANTWGLNFIIFALLLDIIYRNAVLDQACWDLFALIIMSGAISRLYMAKHKVVLGQVINWKMRIVLAVVAFLVAFVAALLAMN